MSLHRDSIDYSSEFCCPKSPANSFKGAGVLTWGLEMRVQMHSCMILDVSIPILNRS